MNFNLLTLKNKLWTYRAEESPPSSVALSCNIPSGGAKKGKHLFVFVLPVNMGCVLNIFNIFKFCLIFKWHFSCQSTLQIIYTYCILSVIEIQPLLAKNVAAVKR